MSLLSLGGGGFSVCMRPRDRGKQAQTEIKQKPKNGGRLHKTSCHSCHCCHWGAGASPSVCGPPGCGKQSPDRGKKQAKKEGRLNKKRCHSCDCCHWEGILPLYVAHRAGKTPVTTLRQICSGVHSVWFSQAHRAQEGADDNNDTCDNFCSGALVLSGPLLAPRAQRPPVTTMTSVTTFFPGALAFHGPLLAPPWGRGEHQ